MSNPQLKAEIRHGDCVALMRELPDNSVDSIVTDPPYGLGFMGKEWDDLPPSKDWAAEALRVLKPGGHLLAFGGTRTYHRLAVAIEDAGFEIRDSMMWLYGSGFPKSHDVSKAIDKKRDDYPAIKTVVMFIREALNQSGKTRNDLERALGGSAVAAHFLKPSRTNASCPSWQQWQMLKTLLKFDDSMDDEVWRLNGRKGKPGEAWESRPITGKHANSAAQQVWVQNYSDHIALPPKERRDIPATDSAKQWHGWGTALKPAHEPIVVARKPLIGTVAENVLEWGVGAMNIDGCRIAGALEGNPNRFAKTDGGDFVLRLNTPPVVRTEGRWPANVVLSHTVFCDDECAEGCPVAELDKQSGIRAAGAAPKKNNVGFGDVYREGTSRAGVEREARIEFDSGGASRFFYVAKANKRERPNVDGVAHPTVKPLALMRWLVRLVTPLNGTVLEPFAGSGTTIEAALLEGCSVLAFEKTADYLPLIHERIRRTKEKVNV